MRSVPLSKESVTVLIIKCLIYKQGIYKNAGMFFHIQETPYNKRFQTGCEKKEDVLRYLYSF